MAIGKKAIFFTLISLLFILVVIAFFNPNSEYYSYMSKVPTLKARITKSNIFMHSIYEEIGVRSLKYSTHQAVISLFDYINVTNKSINNLQADFASVLLNGTINGVSLESQGITSMKNRTLTEMLAAFTLLAHDELNLDTNLTINSVSIYQDESTGYQQFAVALNLTTRMDSGAAIWDTTEVIVTTLDIDRFIDPYYLINLDYSNRIQFSNISNWTTINQVFNHINDFQYTYETGAPSFLTRFENKTTNSTCCGIESLINPVKLNFAQNYDLSYVDYCFYGQPKVESCGYPSYTRHNFTIISAAFPGFKLEIYHINKYNLTKDIDKD